MIKIENASMAFGYCRHLVAVYSIRVGAKLRCLGLFVILHGWLGDGVIRRS